MSASDRFFLEDTSSTLEERLNQKIFYNKDIAEHDVQDFEVSYAISSAENEVLIQVSYPYLESTLEKGSQSLLEHAWEGLLTSGALAVEKKVATDGPYHGSLVLYVTINLERLVGDEAPKRCIQQLASTRIWLLSGPLVERLRWLRDSTSTAKKNVTVSAEGQVPPLLKLQVRQGEDCWIVCKKDRVVIIFTVHLDDEVDVALGRSFCLEFAEAKSEALKSSFSDSRKDEPPADLAGTQSSKAPNVGYLIFSLSDQVVRNATEERLISLAQPVMNWRNFFNFHLKMTKSYLHSRLRKKIETWQQTMKGARRAPRKGQEKRRTAQGKEFVQSAPAQNSTYAPPSRTT
jgi:actin related protein 2/3 complex subunit 2